MRLCSAACVTEGLRARGDGGIARNESPRNCRWGEAPERELTRKWEAEGERESRLERGEETAESLGVVSAGVDLLLSAMTSSVGGTPGVRSRKIGLLSLQS